MAAPLNDTLKSVDTIWNGVWEQTRNQMNIPLWRDIEGCFDMIVSRQVYDQICDEVLRYLEEES